MSDHKQNDTELSSKTAICKENGNLLDKKTAPVVFEKDGQAIANSRDVAEFFGKQHKNVLRDIGNLECSDDFRRLNFEPTSQTVGMPNGGERQERSIDMTRDGFTFLVMGFTGKEAAKFKEQYIAQFNAMEKALREQVATQATLSSPAALRGLLLDYTEKVLELEAKLEEAKPKLDGFDRIAHADGSLCVTDAAKALQMRPKDLFSWLAQNGWIYRRPGGIYLGYQSKTTQGLLEHKTTTVYRADGTEKITEQVRVTPKGLTKLALVFGVSSQEAAE